MEIDLNSIISIESLLKSYPSLQHLPNTDRIRCSWTQHEMPARIEAIEKYIHGKKYQQLLKKKLDNDYLNKFKEFLEPSTKKNHERQLFCKLTWRHLNKEPHHIMRHIEGKRFKRAYTLWRECQTNGTEYIPIGRRKKKLPTSNNDGDDDDEYIDLSDDEDDLSDLYPDFHRLCADDSGAGTMTESPDEETGSGTKRKAQLSRLKTSKKLAASSVKRMRSSDQSITNGNNDSIPSTQIVTLII